MSKAIVYDKALQFSVRIVKLYKYLKEEKKEYIISKQIMRSGTSIGANIAEASGGQSKRDFISKIQISLKEANETKYWMELLLKTDYIDKFQYENLKADADEIQKLLTSILKTTKKNLKEKEH